MGKYLDADLFNVDCSDCPKLHCWDEWHSEVSCHETLCECSMNENAYYCPQCDEERIIDYLINNGLDYDSNQWVENATAEELLDFIDKEM